MYEVMALASSSSCCVVSDRAVKQQAASFVLSVGQCRCDGLRSSVWFLAIVCLGDARLWRGFAIVRENGKELLEEARGATNATDRQYPKDSAVTAHSHVQRFYTVVTVGRGRG